MNESMNYYGVCRAPAVLGLLIIGRKLTCPGPSELWFKFTLSFYLYILGSGETSWNPKQNVAEPDFFAFNIWDSEYVIFSQKIWQVSWVYFKLKMLHPH